MEIKCQFINPVNLGSENNPDWEFSEIICNATTTEDYTLLIQHPTTTEANFLIEKKFDYGSITLNFLLILLIFILIFKLVKDMVFHKETRIHTIHQREF